MSDEYEEDFLLDKDGNLVKDEKGNFIRKADASAKNLEDHAKEREGKYDGNTSSVPYGGAILFKSPRNKLS